MTPAHDELLSPSQLQEADVLFFQTSPEAGNSLNWLLASAAGVTLQNSIRKKLGDDAIALLVIAARHQTELRSGEAWQNLILASEPGQRLLREVERTFALPNSGAASDWMRSHLLSFLALAPVPNWLTETSFWSTLPPWIWHLPNAEFLAAAAVLNDAGALIRRIDCSCFDHAAIFVEQTVIEAVDDGVVRRKLHESAAGAAAIEVYRRIEPWDEPSRRSVSAVAHGFADAGGDYSYAKLFLLGPLVLWRHAELGLPIAAARLLGDAALAALLGLQSDDARKGRQPMICSELVYRCFAQADPRLALSVSSNFGQQFSGWSGLVGYLKGEVGAQSRAPKSAGNVAAYADFITPGDLSRSPDLRRVGTLDLEKVYAHG